MNCDICGKKVDVEQEKKDYPYWWKSLKFWTINASVIGEVNELKGHRECLQNVDNKVVIPARINFVFLMRDIKKQEQRRMEENGVDKEKD